MIFHENRLLSDDSHVHVISYLIFVENWGKCDKICRLLQSGWALSGLKLGIPINTKSTSIQCIRKCRLFISSAAHLVEV